MTRKQSAEWSMYSLSTDFTSHAISENRGVVCNLHTLSKRPLSVLHSDRHLTDLIVKTFIIEPLSLNSMDQCRENAFNTLYLKKGIVWMTSHKRLIMQ